MSNSFSSKGGYRSKPLKGGGVSSNYGIFDTIIANTVKFENVQIEGIVEDLLLSNVIIEDSIINNTPIGLDEPNAGQFTTLNTFSYVNFSGSLGSVSWDPSTSLFFITSDLRVGGCSLLGNLDICNNTISAVNSNGDIIISPNNLGKVSITGPINNVSNLGNLVITMITGGGTVTTYLNQIYTSQTGSITLNGNNGIQLNSTQGITQNASFITLNSLNDITLNSLSDVFINSLSDIFLNTTNGSVFIPDKTKLSFNTTTNTSIFSSSGNLVILSPSLYFSNSNLFIPQNSLLNVGSTILKEDTSGNFSITDTNSISFISSITNINNSSGQLNIRNTLTNISSNTLNISSGSLNINSSVSNISGALNIRDPIVSISAFSTGTNDFLDRGIEYFYFNSQANLMNRGWFGWKNSDNAFEFYQNALNSNEIISGTLGNIKTNTLFMNNIIFQSQGNIDLNCGSLQDVTTITGCTTGIVISSSSLSLSNANINIPQNSYLNFGSNYYFQNTSGNLVLNNNSIGNFVINSNVIINGTTTNVYTQNTYLQDPILSLNKYSTNLTFNDNKDRGIEFFWHNGSTEKLGFFGFDNSKNRFVFIPDGINTNEVFSGSLGNVEFNNGFFNNLDLNNGSISNVSFLSSNSLTVSTGNLNLNSPLINFPATSSLLFGSSASIISSSGSLVVSANITRISSSSVLLNNNTSLGFGSVSNIVNSNGNLIINNTVGDILLYPRYSSGNIFIPSYTDLNFANTSNGIYSDGSQLYIYGNDNASITVPVLTITGNVNILGNLNSISTSFDQNAYMLELGTDLLIDISTVTTTSTSGVYRITTDTVNYLNTGDLVLLKDTNTIPIIDGTYSVISSVSPFAFNISTGNLSSLGTGLGTVRSNLTFDQQKDVGIQVNYWSTVGNTSITSGSANYKTGFFGFQRSTERWVYYNNATIANNVIINGSYSDIQINKLFTNNISGFILDGNLIGGSQLISGTNFSISGGNINNTPIGMLTPNQGSFTNLVSNTNTTLANVSFSNSLYYSSERLTTGSLFLTKSPTLNKITSIVKVIDNNINTSGTMPSSALDGSYKIIACSQIGLNSTYTLFFGSGKLITPNPLNPSAQPEKITFKRQSQSAHFIYDSDLSAWILLSSGGYVS